MSIGAAKTSAIARSGVSPNADQQRYGSCDRHRQSGMTLVEIMISLLIGAFLLGGILQIFIGTKQSYRMQEGFSRLQENGRFVLDFLKYDSRMAGFQGCSVASPNIIIDPKNPNPNPTPSTLAMGLNVVVSGSNNVANNWNVDACGNAGACVANTDAITINYGETCGGTLPENADNANVKINKGNTCNFSQYDIVMISDCSSADIFIATSVSNSSTKQTIAHANNQNTDNKLSKVYEQGAEVFRFNSFTYFLREGASGEPALWRLDNTKNAPTGSNPVELIEGVEDMQILYGEDTDADGTANYYVAADSVVNFDNVLSIRFNMRVRTVEANLTPAGDGRLRQTFSTTVAIRNRLP
ncbi:MAG: PilW family protein [Methylomicrobium sp.]